MYLFNIRCTTNNKARVSFSSASSHNNGVGGLYSFHQQPSLALKLNLKRLKSFQMIKTHNEYIKKIQVRNVILLAINKQRLLFSKKYFFIHLKSQNLLHILCFPNPTPPSFYWKNPYIYCIPTSFCLQNQCKKLLHILIQGFLPIFDQHPAQNHSASH